MTDTLYVNCEGIMEEKGGDMRKRHHNIQHKNPVNPLEHDVFIKPCLGLAGEMKRI
jgi:hypothetical protein